MFFESIFIPKWDGFFEKRYLNYSCPHIKTKIKIKQEDFVCF